MSISKNIKDLKASLPKNVKLVAVSKNHSCDAIMEAYNSEHRIFGENRVQELLTKQPILPNDIEWHMIGHLQTNKVKYVVPFVSLIHGVDSFKLLKTINKESEKKKIITNCLLQVFIAKEETKFGLSKEELFEILDSQEFISLNNVCVRGLMGMASFVDDMLQVRNEFKYLKNLFIETKEKYFDLNEYFNELSMGMSSDYKIAIEEGATIVRIGSTIFGER